MVAPSLGASTVNAIVVVWLSPDQVPVTVTVETPVWAEAPAAIVIDVDRKDAVTPLGNPEAEKLTTPVKPFTGVMRIVVGVAMP